MEDRVSLYPGRVTLTPVEGQANTYDMVRADQPTQAGTPLSKANLLKDLTAAQFGLDENAVPDDVLSWLGKYNEHWWSALHGEASSYTKYSSSKTEITSRVDLVTGGNLSNNETYTISYSNSVTCDASGVHLANPTTKTYTNKTSYTGATNLRKSLYSDLSAMPLPCYITSSQNTNVYYVPNGATFGNSESTNYKYTVSVFSATTDSDDYDIRVGFGKASDVSVVVQSVKLTSEIVTIPAGETIYEHSTDRNAYPDSGTQDGITYTYLGVPFEKFPSAPRLAIGNYTGTGKYGTGNKNTLTFNFIPKVVFIAPSTANNSGVYGYGYCMIFTDRLKATSFGDYAVGDINVFQIYYSCENNTVSWYNSNSAARQCNASAYVYNYFALG